MVSPVNTFRRSRHTLPMVRLEPGELFLGERPAEIHTLLGSCVAAVIHDPAGRRGAMCHAQLPGESCRQVAWGLKVGREMSRYVTCSMHLMLAWLDHTGAKRHQLEVKLFGGANMYGMPQDGLMDSVGQNNIQAAKRVVTQEGLNLVASDLGGVLGRTLVYHSDSGEVRLKRIAQHPKGEKILAVT